MPNNNYPPFFSNEFTAWKLAASHGPNQTRAVIENDNKRNAYYHPDDHYRFGKRPQKPMPLPTPVPVKPTVYDEKHKVFVSPAKRRKHEPEEKEADEIKLTRACHQLKN